MLFVKNIIDLVISKCMLKSWGRGYKRLVHKIAIFADTRMERTEYELKFSTGQKQCIYPLNKCITSQYLIHL